MLFLNGDEMEKSITYAEVMESVKEAYRVYRTGQFHMPERPSVSWGSKQLLFMPCFTENLLGTKVLSLFPENVALGKPTIYGQMILNDFTTGECQCIMDGTKLTALRTGAAGGVAISCLSAPNSRSVGIVGAGAQGLYQAVYAAQARPIEKVYIYDAFVKDLQPFIGRVKAKVGRELEYIPCTDAVELVKQADIIVTTTLATDPVLPDDPALLVGKCFVGVGSYRHDMREFPPAVWKVCDTVYVDLEYAMEESGDLSQPLEQGQLRKEQVRLLGEIVDAPVQKLASGKSAFFKTVGMALVDVIAAAAIYRKALDKGLGTKV